MYEADVKLGMFSVQCSGTVQGLHRLQIFLWNRVGNALRENNDILTSAHSDVINSNPDIDVVFCQRSQRGEELRSAIEAILCLQEFGAVWVVVLNRTRLQTLVLGRVDMLISSSWCYTDVAELVRRCSKLVDLLCFTSCLQVVG